jgi:TonB family protein
MTTTLNAQIQKAMYSVSNLDSLLAKKVSYPLESLKSSSEGDVIISFTITKDGKLENPGIEKSPDLEMSKASMEALKNLTAKWVPAKSGDSPINKKYFAVFRYRIYYNSAPTPLSAAAEKQVNKGNFPKALKHYNNAIEENPYDKNLFLARSKTKKALGDEAGSAQDNAEYLRLDEEIMAVIDLFAIATQKTVTRTVTTTSSRL